MLLIIGFVLVAVFLVYKRSQEIITVNPMRFTPPSLPGQDQKNSQTLDFSRLLNTIQEAAAEAAKEANQQSRPSGAKLPDKGRAAIRAMVKNQQFIEAIKRYREVYGVDLRTAKKAVDEMMLEE